MTPIAAPLIIDTELYIDPATKVARVQWSRTLSIDSSGNVTFGTAAHHQSDVVTVPTALQVGGHM